MRASSHAKLMADAIAHCRAAFAPESGRGADGSPWVALASGAEADVSLLSALESGGGADVSPLFALESKGGADVSRLHALESREDADVSPLSALESGGEAHVSFKGALPYRSSELKRSDPNMRNLDEARPMGETSKAIRPRRITRFPFVWSFRWLRIAQKTNWLTIMIASAPPWRVSAARSRRFQRLGWSRSTSTRRARFPSS